MRRTLRHAPVAPALPADSCYPQSPRPPPGPRFHTAWLPRSCSSGDMAGATMSSGLVRTVSQLLTRLLGHRHALRRRIRYRRAENADFALARTPSGAYGQRHWAARAGDGGSAAARAGDGAAAIIAYRRVRDRREKPRVGRFRAVGGTDRGAGIVTSHGRATEPSGQPSRD